MIVGIISEYNPFHNGHLYQIEKIREEFGQDTAIVAVMSGNYVQRGSVAIADKALRSKCAVLSGVNLVLELPFPFSMSCAEIFAKSAVHILNSIGCVDVLSFGSESGNIDRLTKIAKTMMSDEYTAMINEIREDGKHTGLSYPKMCELALNRLHGDDDSVEFTPNNILALEYIKSILASNSSIHPHTIQRKNSSFSDESIIDGSIQSATAIRSAIGAKDITALEYIPNSNKNIILDAIKDGDFPCDEERLAPAIISSFRLNSSTANDQIQDAAHGLYNRLRDISFEANTVYDMVISAESKKFTKSRIRRAIYNSYLSVTSSHVSELPAYTQLLALDEIGRGILKSIRKQCDFPIITKPSNYNEYGEAVIRQKQLSDRADSVFQLSKPIAKDGNLAIRFTPYVKK